MIDTEPIATKAWQQTFRELGYELKDDLNQKMIGRNVADSDTVVTKVLNINFP